MEDLKDDPMGRYCILKYKEHRMRKILVGGKLEGEA